MRLSRRQVLTSIAAAAPALALPSCWVTRRVEVRCPDWAIDPQGPLAIDAHVHLFNASDLAVEGFVRKVLLRSDSGAVKSIAGLLQALTWSVAPSGAEEAALLTRLTDELRSCRTDPVPRSVVAARDASYRRARREIQAAARRSAPAAAELRFATAGGAAALPESYDAFATTLERAAEIDGRVERTTVRSALLFVVEMLQYRTTSFFDYLDAFRRGGGPRIDLSLSAMVDYDWWLEGGREPPTPLRRQIEVAADLAVLTGGRVHAWAPFCPLREVVHRLSGRSFSSLDLVRWAVEEQGAVGVKLYPPMGFAAYGNAGRSVWKGVKDLPGETQRADFGARLDGALHDLYRWCEARDVPILAHTTASNGPRASFEELALAPGWAAALDAHPRLRVLFGHFGGGGDAGAAAHAVAFRDLMRPGGAGATAFADASYFGEALEDPGALEARLLPFFDAPTGVRPLLLDRFCFGSDWKMLALERRAGQYPARLAQVVRVLAEQQGFRAPQRLVDAFFGANTATLLGLHAGEPARRRLDAFYAARRVPRPSWAAKLDGSTGSPWAETHLRSR